MYSPNYERLLERGDAGDVGDLAAVGSEADVLRRLRSFADAGTTDLSVRVLPVGEGRDALRRVESPDAREFLSWLAPEIT